MLRVELSTSTIHDLPLKAFGPHRFNHTAPLGVGVYDVPTLRCTRAKPLVLKMCRSGSLLLAHQTDYRLYFHVHAHELPIQTYLLQLVVIDRGTRNCITSSRGSNPSAPSHHHSSILPCINPSHEPWFAPFHNNPYSSPTTPHQYLRNGSHRHPPIAHRPSPILSTSISQYPGITRPRLLCCHCQSNKQKRHHVNQTLTDVAQKSRLMCEMVRWLVTPRWF
jgi:hypothetical protein